MFDTSNGFDAHSLRLIGALTHEPGYILLCDMLQSHLDNLTDRLADPSLPDSDAPAKLRYWQAFRDILRRLKTEPQNFSVEHNVEHPDNLPDEI